MNTGNVRFRAFVAFFALAALPAFSQQTGQIVGMVTDASNAVAPNVTVTAIEAGTGYERKGVTDASGHFVIPSLRPAVYDVTAQAAGFRPFRRRDVELLANQSLTVNVTLEVGNVTEAVTVEAPVVQVDTSTSTLRETVDRARLVELPLNGRNAAALTTLVPGNVIAPSAAIDQGSTKTAPGGMVISSSGSRQNQVSYRLDGGDNVDRYTNINMPFPFPDALQEFSIQTSNYTAEFGGNAGAEVNVVTKSGTNEFHGGGFEFVRNGEFNARNFFAPKTDVLKRNQFGVFGGGPVMLPHYDGHNRTFFFAGWQETILRNTNNSANAFVPTNDELAGNFTTCGSTCAKAIKDPLTGNPFPNNQIPVSRFDPAALKLTQSYLPRIDGSGLIFYGGAVHQNTDEGILKIDHLFGEKDRISGRYYVQQFRDAPPYVPQDLLTYSNIAGIRSQSAVLNETHTFSPTLLNEAVFTYSRTYSTRLPPGQMPNVGDFGVNIYQPSPSLIESVAVTGFFNVGVTAVATFVRNNFEWNNTTRWVHGAHSISAGGTIARERMDIVNQSMQYGMFTFNGNVTGQAMADFLLGRMQQFIQGSGQFQNSRDTFPALFVQDDIKATRRLTLNLGVRYEPFTPWSETRNRIDRFRISDYLAGVRSTVYKNAPAGLTYPGDPGFPDNGAEGDLNNISPRAGFAWDVFGNGSTSLRGGVGIFYDQRRASIYDNTWGIQTPFSTALTLVQPAGGFSNPYQGRDNPFPAPPPSADSPFPTPVKAFTYGPRETTAASYNWNLTLERNLPGNWLARVAYVASRGTHLIRVLELDPAVNGPGATTANTDARRLFAPSYGSIREYSPDGNSTYHSLQASLNRRFSHGMTVMLNYTFSKALDDMPQTSNIFMGSSPPTLPWYTPGGERFDYGPASFDHTQRLVLSYVWDLPSWKSSSPFARFVASGWQMSGIFQTQTGDPMTVLSGRDNSLTGLNNDRGQYNGLSVDRPDGADAVQEFFNTSVFSLNQVGTFGNIGKGRLRGPGLLSWDMGLFKETTIRERFNTQFRAEFFNVLNHANFADPNTSLSSPSFGQILTAQDPRILQFGFKVLF